MGGLPAEWLIPSLVNKCGQLLRQQGLSSQSSAGTSQPVSGGTGFPYYGLTMPNPPRSRSSQRPGSLGGQANLLLEQNYVPAIIGVEEDSCRWGDRENDSNIIPSEPGQTNHQNSHAAVTVSASSRNSVTEVLLQQLSPSEKDQLLRQLLPLRGRLHRHGRPGSTRPPKYDTRVSTGEVAVPVEVLDVQTGLFSSFNGKEVPKCPVDNINEEAIKHGIRVSKQEFRELCCREDQKEEALIDEAKRASLRHYNHICRKREGWIVNEAKRESLACPNLESQEQIEIEEANQIIEEQIIGEAKLESLHFPPMTKEERLVEEVKVESIIAMQAKLEESQGRQGLSYMSTYNPDCDVREVSPTRKSRSRASPVARAAYPFTRVFDSTGSSHFSQRTPTVLEGGDWSTSSISDRKPHAQSHFQLNDTSSSP